MKLSGHIECKPRLPSYFGRIPLSLSRKDPVTGEIHAYFEGSDLFCGLGCCRYAAVAHLWEQALRRVVFLDFDGVVRREGAPISGSKLEPHLVDLLNQFCEESLSSVVLSTSWRLYYNGTIPELTKVLRGAGFRGAVIGSIPKLEEKWNPYDSGSRPKCPTRGEEILAWLEEHPMVGHYVVFEDEEDLTPVPQSHIVRTRSRWGLNSTAISQAQKALKVPR